MKNILENNKGITLIALVITIIVLLILAGVAISMLAGDNGILKQAAKAKEETEKASGIEEAKIEVMGYVMEFGMTKENLNQEEALKSCLIIRDEDIIKKYIPSYDSSKFKLALFSKKDIGNFIICEVDEIMTDEKIAACEEAGIYLLGDTNGDRKVNEFDNVLVYDLNIGKEPYNLLTSREKIVADADGDGVYSNIDASKVTKIGKNYQYTKIEQEVKTMKEEFLDNYDEELLNSYVNALYLIRREYEGNDDNVQKYIPSYDRNEYKFVILNGNLFCVQDPIMTKEKIEVCEKAGIYLIGDTNQNGKIDSDDKSMIQTKMIKGLQREDYRKRQWLTMDTNGSGTVNDNDINFIEYIISQDGE